MRLEPVFFNADRLAQPKTLRAEREKWRADAMTSIRQGDQTGNAPPKSETRDHSPNGEERLRAMIEASVDCVIMIDAQSTILEFNAAAEQTFGCRRDDVIGEPLTQAIIPPSLRDAYQRGVAALLKGGTSKLLGKRVEMRAMRSDGSEFPVELTVTQIPGQTPPIFTAYLRDITERVEAEEASNAQTVRYKTLMEMSIEAIYILDEKGDLQEANAAFLNRRGYTAAEAKGLNVADWDAHWSREQLQERLRKLVGGSTVVEARHRCRDGSVFDVEVCATSVRIGTEQLFFCVTRDITQRKQAEQALRESEERFRELAENIDDFVWLSDPLHNELLYISSAYERIWGHTRASLYAAPKSWTEALHPDDRERILKLRGDDHLREMPDVTYRIIRPDGSLRWIHSREFPVKGADGKIMRVAGIVSDITERKRVDLALDERLRFETLLTELSAAFANLPAATVDQEIDKWLQNLVEFLDLDRAILDQVEEDGRTLSRTHSHTVRGIETHPFDVANRQVPWITEELLKGNTVKWSRIPDDIPEQAPKEREFAIRVGAKSLLSIPVCIGRSVICVVSFTSLRICRDWPDEMVARLRLVGEIFANAIARKRAAKELEEANHQLRFLSRQLFHLQEEERRHLARELHDEVGQSLTAAKINLQTAIKESDPAKSKRIDETSAILERLLGQVRQISLDLRPSTLDDLGLVPALRSLLDQQAQRASIAARFSAENVPENLSPEIRTTCFRIAQEAITNAVRHANATQIDLHLGGENGNLRLQVRDNGRGFDADSAQAQRTGLGLIGMKERAALVQAQAKIISSPNNGTTVEVSLPLMSPFEREGRESGR